MKPNLILGIGNALMGADGVAWHVIERLRTDPRLPADTEVLWGGADLLRNSAHLAGREHVLVVDAALEAGEPGHVCLLDLEPSGKPAPGEAPGPGQSQRNAHHLSAIEAIELLQMAFPDLRKVRFALAGIAVGSAHAGEELPPQLAARLPQICARILALL